MRPGYYLAVKQGHPPWLCELERVDEKGKGIWYSKGFFRGDPRASGYALRSLAPVLLGFLEYHPPFPGGRDSNG